MRVQHSGQVSSHGGAARRLSLSISGVDHFDPASAARLLRRRDRNRPRGDGLRLRSRRVDDDRRGQSRNKGDGSERDSAVHGFVPLAGLGRRLTRTALPQERQPKCALPHAGRAGPIPAASAQSWRKPLKEGCRRSPRPLTKRCGRRTQVLRRPLEPKARQRVAFGASVVFRP